MRQQLKQFITQYHHLFDGGRCSGWELEELIVKAIKADTQAQHHVLWKEGGHDDKADIVIHTSDVDYKVQVKSGQFDKKNIVLSGHRLGRFKGDLKAISDYLNSSEANIISVPYYKKEDSGGRKHVYKLCYVDVKNLHGLIDDNWKKKKTVYEQVNEAGVVFSLYPSMSWQIWWRIPITAIEVTDIGEIG